MAVVRNGDYWFYEWKVKGKKVRRSSGLKVTEVSREFVKEREAKAKAKILKEEFGVTVSTGKVPTILEAADRIYDDLWHKYGDSQGPLQRLEYFANEVVGDIPINKITTEHLMELKENLEDRGLRPSSVNRYLSAVTAMLKHALLHWKVIEQVPLALRADERGNARIRVVDWVEEDMILKGCDELGDQDFKDLFIVLIDTGMRRNEALTLNYRVNVNFTEGMITLSAPKTKTKQIRSIPMTKRVREVLDRRLSLGLQEPFSTFSKYAPLKRLTRVCELVGLPTEGEERIVIHSLRHTFASRLVRAGVPIFEVSTLLGHASVITTEKFYAHLSVDTLRGSIDVLEREHKSRRR